MSQTSPRPRVGVLDYGSGNIRSACHALERAGADVVLSSSHDELRAAGRLVVPGVGAFAACMAGLTSVGGGELITEFVEAGNPVLGICVGHQIFFAEGNEHGDSVPGLGIFPGAVSQLAATRLPHMGWNQVESPTDSRLFAGLGGRRFYFVHSYAAHFVDGFPSDALVSLAEHESDQFIAAVERGSLCSTQFHPEKSGAAGAELLRNWLIG